MPTVEARPWPAVELRRRAMGTEVHLRVVLEPGRGCADPSGLLIELDQRLDELEQLWSRFLPDSDISRVNRSAGAAVSVSHETQLLVRRACEAWRRTDGLFDPMVLPALTAAGYGASFDEISAPSGAPGTPVAVTSVPTCDWPVPAKTRASGCDAVRVDELLGTVAVPRGGALDPGGIGKGLAADLLAVEAMAQGAAGVLVNVGGDLRVEGACDDGIDGWLIEIAEPAVDVAARVSLISGAVASSTPLRRRWHTDDGVAHHLIDPATGRPTGSAAPHLVTVVAPHGWLAEALTKALHVGWERIERGRLVALLAATGASALVVTPDAEIHLLAAMEDYLS